MSTHTYVHTHTSNKHTNKHPHTDSFAIGLRERINFTKRATAKDPDTMRVLELDLREAADMVEHAAHAALTALIVVCVGVCEGCICA